MTRYRISFDVADKLQVDIEAENADEAERIAEERYSVLGDLDLRNSGENLGAALEVFDVFDLDAHKAKRLAEREAAKAKP